MQIVARDGRRPNMSSHTSGGKQKLSTCKICKSCMDSALHTGTKAQITMNSMERNPPATSVIEVLGVVAGRSRSVPMLFHVLSMIVEDPIYSIETQRVRSVLSYMSTPRS